MKKLVVAIAVGMVCLGAMAQGRVQFNNSGRAVYVGNLAYTPTVGADAGISAPLVVDLYVGSSAGSLVFSGLSANAWSTAATTLGQFTPVTGNLPTGFAGGTTTKWYFQAQVRSSNFATAAAAQASQQPGAAWGFGDVFQAYASSSAISANSLTQTASPSFSTWALGNVVLANSPVGGSISVSVVAVPEPTSFALAGLGAAALLIFRRRN